MGTLDGKITIVTGTTSGMGREIARRFVKEGAIVVGFARRVERHNELAAELGENYIPFPGDLMKDEDIRNCVDMVLDKYGKVDVLVNNAGINDDMYALGNLVDDAWFDRCMTVNLTAPLEFMRAVLPSMVDEMEGNIINIASVGGIRGCRAGTVYTAAKHGIIGATKNIAYMYADEGVRCNAVCPGGYGTECVPTANADKFGYERSMIAASGMPSMGTPDKIANLVAFLASEEADNISGASITSDFGWSAM